MSAEHKFHSYEVPEGFPPMSLPTKAETRLPKELIKIEYCDERDLIEWSALCYEAFPDAFWDSVEDTEKRPSLPERIKVMAKHFTPWLSQPGFHALKAVHGETGELMGVAGWHESGVHAIFPTHYESMGGSDGPTFPNTFVPCSWRDGLAKELGIIERMNWTEDDIKEMTSFHSPNYLAEFGGYDRGRIAEMGDTPHWYLAPLAVWPKWNGRGVGRELLRWGLDRADEKGWPAVLEALPNARPVYYHVGFEPTAHKGQFKDNQLVRPAQKK